MKAARARSSGCSRSAATIPAMPHTSGSPQDAVFERSVGERVAVDAFTKPELELAGNPAHGASIEQAGCHDFRQKLVLNGVRIDDHQAQATPFGDSWEL